MGKGLDERQRQIIDRIGAHSFCSMFLTGAAVILAELIWLGNFQAVAGETVIFLAGGLVYLSGCLKNGIWEKSGKNMTAGQAFLFSVICSGFFSVFYGIAINQKAAQDMHLAKYVAAFFVGITALSFVSLQIMGKIARMSQEKQEKKYSE